MFCLKAEKAHMFQEDMYQKLKKDWVYKMSIKKQLLIRGLIGAAVGFFICYFITIITSVIIGNGGFYPVVPQAIELFGTELKCSNSSNNYKYDIRRNFKRYIGHMGNRQVEFNKANNYSFTDLFNSYISCCLLSVLDAAQCNFDFDLLQCFYYNIFLYMAYIIYQNKNYNKKKINTKL